MHLLLHACIEVRVVSQITVGVITKPTVIGLHHYRFYYKTGSDGHHQCRFCFKTIIDVSAPYKMEPGTYTSTHPHFTLNSQFHVLSLLTLFTLRGHGSWMLHCRYIYSPLSHCSYVYLHRRFIFI